MSPKTYVSLNIPVKGKDLETSECLRSQGTPEKRTSIAEIQRQENERKRKRDESSKCRELQYKSSRETKGQGNSEKVPVKKGNELENSEQRSEADNAQFSTEVTKTSRKHNKSQ